MGKVVAKRRVAALQRSVRGVNAQQEARSRTGRRRYSRSISLRVCVRVCVQLSRVGEWVIVRSH